MTDREKFLSQAKTYLGKTGYDVCISKLHLGFICDWCAFSVSSIMNDCGFIGKYIKAIEGGAGTIPRYSDGKYGDWFKKGARAPQAGDLFFLRYNDYPYQDKYFCDHIGIVESVSGNTLTTLEGNVDGYGSDWAGTSTFRSKTRYLSDYTVYAFYRPNWQDGTTKPDADNTKTVPDAVYQVHTVGGSWLPEVTNFGDYAGLPGKPIDGVRISVSRGHVRYRVKFIGGSWLPWVRDLEDYAGLYGKPIDCLQFEFYGLSNQATYVAEYRVANVGKPDYLDTVRQYNNVNEDGYAGLIGKPIDRLQVRVVKKS